jgi:hypothetical protein
MAREVWYIKTDFQQIWGPLHQKTYEKSSLKLLFTSTKLVISCERRKEFTQIQIGAMQLSFIIRIFKCFGYYKKRSTVFNSRLFPLCISVKTLLFFQGSDLTEIPILCLLSVCGFTVLLLDLSHFISFLILYTVGRTRWTEDKPIGRPLPTHRTTQTQNKCTQSSIHALSGIRTHDPSVRASEDSLLLRPRGHCDRHRFYTLKEYLYRVVYAYGKLLSASRNIMNHPPRSR